jgi:hypothetical protein
MKKIFFIVAVIITLLITSCGTYRNFYILQKDYDSTQNELVLKDVYTSLRTLDIDSIPLNDWMTFQGYDGNGFFIQRVVKKDEKKTNYTLIFTTFYDDSTYYNYKIRCKTKNKDLWPSFK